MASLDDSDAFGDVLGLAVVKYGDLCAIIAGLQKVTGSGRGFKDVLSSYKAMPDWSSEEAEHFRGTMALIKDGCTRYDDLVDAARAYVIRTKEFAKENIDFIGNVQEKMDPRDVEDLLTEWIENIDELKECNDKIATMKGQFRQVLDKLETAKGLAASGKSSGQRKAKEADDKSVLYAVGGAVGTVVGGAATVATGGLAAIPMAAATSVFGGWSFTSAIQSAADSIKGFFYGPDTTSDDSSIQGKYKEWEMAFAHVARQLDKAYTYVSNKTDESKKILNDLSEYSKKLLNKSKRMATAEKIERIQESEFVQKQFKRLEDESGKVKTACIEYIKNDNETRGITGTMARLSLE